MNVRTLRNDLLGSISRLKVGGIERIPKEIWHKAYSNPPHQVLYHWCITSKSNSFKFKVNGEPKYFNTKTLDRFYEIERKS